MAATYRLVVSSINCYSSVVVDRRSQEAVHYCDGPCGLLKRGLECMVTHRGLCYEPVVIQSPVSAEFADGPPTLDIPSSAQLRNYRPSNEKKHHRHFSNSVPAFRGGSSVQTPISLKDITGDAINLACGKIKEVSMDHVPLRRGRRAQLDSFCRRSVDVDLAGGQIIRNDENCPPLCLLPRPRSEHLGKFTNTITSEQSTSLHSDRSTEKNLIAQILELTKNDTGTSGEDIRSCLSILLKCSDDLKKCTNIIRQCIRRKSFGEDNRNHENEVINQDIMARLSSHLKKFPLGFECGLSDSQCLSNSPKLVNTLHELQQALFYGTFEDEQPPRYEDVVCCTPPIKALHPSLSLPDDEEAKRNAYNSEKPIQEHPNLISQDSSPALCGAQCDFSVSLHPSMPDSNIHNHNESGQLGYIQVEPHEAEILDRKCEGAGKFHTDFMFESNVSVEQSDLAAVEVLGNSWKMASVKTEQLQYQEVNEEFQSRETESISDDMDKVLAALENLSRNTDKEFRNCGQQTDRLPCSTFNVKGKNPEACEVSKEDQSKLLTASSGCHGGLINVSEMNKNGDSALLLQILEKIEIFAQELVEGYETKASSVGPRAKEQEVTELLQNSLPKSSTVSTTEVKQQAVTVEEQGAIMIIQQAQEVIGVQNGPEEKAELLALASMLHTAGESSVVTGFVSASIPDFYFPKGVPVILGATFGETITQIEAMFREFEEQKATIHEMGKIAKLCGYPLYWKAPLFHRSGGGQRGFVWSNSLVEVWRKLSCSCYDDSSKFVYLLAKPNCNYLEQEDFIPLLQDIVDSHPGLTFLKDAPEFHSRYITTVIQRIFYTVNRSWTGRITIPELRRSNFLQTLVLLEEENDINQITDYFSYEHFYVIYCKFWELDTDHNLFIDQQDLARYNCHASSNKIIKRLFSGAVTRGSSALTDGRMSYAEFVWFLISEEDKKTPTSMEYWFRCMDLDGDGVLSMYELEHFYQEQHDRLEAMGVEPLPFHDLLCQVLDLVRPQQPGKVTLWDLKRCGMAHVFYDTFFSLQKYLEHEQRDPFAVQKDAKRDGEEISDWDRFASEEYEILVAEESESEHLEDGSSEDDLESEIQIDSLDVELETDKLVDSDLPTQS